MCTMILKLKGGGVFLESFIHMRCAKDLFKIVKVTCLWSL